MHRKFIAIDLNAYNGKFICQKDAFLCAAKGVSVGIEFSKKIGRALFGGEGFIMQKIEGDGMAFVHSGGTLAKKELAPGDHDDRVVPAHSFKFAATLQEKNTGTNLSTVPLFAG